MKQGAWQADRTTPLQQWGARCSCAAPCQPLTRVWSYSQAVWACEREWRKPVSSELLVAQDPGAAHFANLMGAVLAARQMLRQRGWEVA